MTLEWINGQYIWKMDPCEIAVMHAALSDAIKYNQQQKDEYGESAVDADFCMSGYDEIYQFLNTERPKTWKKN